MVKGSKSSKLSSNKNVKKPIETSNIDKAPDTPINGDPEESMGEKTEENAEISTFPNHNEDIKENKVTSDDIRPQSSADQPISAPLKVNVTTTGEESIDESQKPSSVDTKASYSLPPRPQPWYSSASDARPAVLSERPHFALTMSRSVPAAAPLSSVKELISTAPATSSASSSVTATANVSENPPKQSVQPTRGAEYEYPQHHDRYAEELYRAQMAHLYHNHPYFTSAPQAVGGQFRVDGSAATRSAPLPTYQRGNPPVYPSMYPPAVPVSYMGADEEDDDEYEYFPIVKTGDGGFFVGDPVNHSRMSFRAPGELSEQYNDQSKAHKSCPRQYAQGFYMDNRRHDHLMSTDPRLGTASSSHAHEAFSRKETMSAKRSYSPSTTQSQSAMSGSGTVEHKVPSHSQAVQSASASDNEIDEDERDDEEDKDLEDEGYSEQEEGDAHADDSDMANLLLATHQVAAHEKQKELASMANHPYESDVANSSVRYARGWKTVAKENKGFLKYQGARDKQRFDSEMQVYERVRDMMPAGKSMPPTSRLNPYLDFGHANPGKPVKKKGKRKNRADDDIPKRPISAFLSYNQSVRAKVRLEHPNEQYSEMSGMIARMWHAASEEEKKPHLERELRDRQRYHQEMKEWKEKHSKRSAATNEFDALNRTLTEHHDIANLPLAKRAPPQILSSNQSMYHDRMHPSMPHGLYQGHAYYDGAMSWPGESSRGPTGTGSGGYPMPAGGYPYLPHYGAAYPPHGFSHPLPSHLPPHQVYEMAMRGYLPPGYPPGADARGRFEAGSSSGGSGSGSGSGSATQMLPQSEHEFPSRGSQGYVDPRAAMYTDWQDPYFVPPRQRAGSGGNAGTSSSSGSRRDSVCDAIPSAWNRSTKSPIPSSKIDLDASDREAATLEAKKSGSNEK